MRAIYIVIAVVLPGLAVAQSKQLTVSGTIIDESKQPIPFANVAIYSNIDSVMRSATASDESGKFSLQVKPGKYFLKITFLSYEEKIIEGLTLLESSDLNTVTLKPSARQLKEVTITGEKSQMEFHLDKRIFNVGKDLTNSGGSAADILSNLPSVNVDFDGTVSLRGSENVRILINGRPSGLFSRDPAGLRKLQGSMVERVEVITNPSARYDASGEVGIINIILKKNEEEGFNGNINASAGYPTFYGAGISLNVGRKKTNWYASYGADYRDRPGLGHSTQRFKETGQRYDQKNTRGNEEFSHDVVFGLDYLFSGKSTLTSQVEFDAGEDISETRTEYRDFTDDVLTGTTIRTEREVEDETDLEGTVTWKKEFTTKGHQFTADLKLMKTIEDQPADYTEGLAGTTPLAQEARNNADESQWIFQTDYVRPIPDGKFETGIKSATRIIKNEFGLSAQNSDGTWTTFPAFTNNLIFTERIHAAYLMASKTINKLSVQGGLRGEYSDIKTELTVTNEINPRKYFNVFPSASLSYAIKETKTLQLSYSYRISRPDFRNLLPFSDFRDSRVFFIGNPNLRPEYTHSFEGGYLVDWEGGSVLTSIYHRRRNDVIQRIVTDVDSEGRTQIIPINMAHERAYGFELTLTANINSWWKLNSSINLYRAITEGKYEGDRLFSDTYTANSRTTSRITIAGKWNLQTAFSYRAPRITTQGRELYTGSVDIGVSRDIFDGRATIVANVRDMFNMRKRRTIYDTDTYYSRSMFRWQPRQLTITFTYRINQDAEEDEDDEGAGGEEY